MRRNRVLITTTAVLAVACGLLVLAGCGGAAPAPSRGPGLAGNAPARAGRGSGTAIERAARASAGRTRNASPPLLAVIGASVAAGVGAGHRRDAWPEDLARMLGWRVVVSADPGAGYIKRGEARRGPFAGLAARLHLARRHPAVVLIQGGHNDIGRPLSLLRHRVEALLSTIRREVPGVRVGVLTVFITGDHPSRAALATNQAIITAARRADPRVMVFNPLGAHWHFPRIRDHLHPTAAGHRWIARRLAAGLRRQAPLTCVTVAQTHRRRCHVGVPHPGPAITGHEPARSATARVALASSHVTLLKSSAWPGTLARCMER